ncbi:MAG: aminoglycoside phosphotransferase family protein [Eubacteriales bacterium]|nr:aminoglycoside phosphotransferase family protein [Eubacteriales bacterium]
MNPLNRQTLLGVVQILLGATVADLAYQVTHLHGGTLGDVRRVSGQATLTGGAVRPFDVVWKTQQRWLRPGDPGSWRREYDLFRTDLGRFFSPALRWPSCYLAEMDGSQTHLWLEFIDGVSGRDLTPGMLEQAALELGRFQGRLSRREVLLNITCLGDTVFLRREFAQWHTQTYAEAFLRSDACRLPDHLKQQLKTGDIRLYAGKSFEYSALRSQGCALPEHLKQMIFDLDEQQEERFASLDRLPVVLCHRDFWIENIFATDGGILLIDWDTAGWGYAGEDIASLIIDETESVCVDSYIRQLIPAYRQGLAEFIDVSGIDEGRIIDLILIKFGYRMVQTYLFSDSFDAKQEQVNLLQLLYDHRSR